MMFSVQLYVAKKDYLDLFERDGNVAPKTLLRRVAQSVCKI